MDHGSWNKLGRLSKHPGAEFLSCWSGDQVTWKSRRSNVQRPRDLGLSRIDAVVQGWVGPRSLDATLWWGTIERALSSDTTRFASWEDCTGFDMEDELVETRLEAGRALGSEGNRFGKKWGGPEPWQVSLRMEGRERDLRVVYPVESVELLTAQYCRLECDAESSRMSPKLIYLSCVTYFLWGLRKVTSLPCASVLHLKMKLPHRVVEDHS